jgi:hypothetical protein
MHVHACMLVCVCVPVCMRVCVCESSALREVGLLEGPCTWGRGCSDPLGRTRFPAPSHPGNRQASYYPNQQLGLLSNQGSSSRDFMVPATNLGVEAVAGGTRQ